MAVSPKWSKGGSGFNGSGAAAVTITRTGTEPVAAGDVLLAFVHQRGAAAPQTTQPASMYAPPTPGPLVRGWTYDMSIQASNVGTGPWIDVYHKVIEDAAWASAEQTTYTFTVGSASNTEVVQIVNLGGVDTASIVNGTPWPGSLIAGAHASNSSSGNAPSLTFPSSETLAVLRVLGYSSASANVDPTWDPAATVIRSFRSGSTSETIATAIETVTGASSGTRGFTTAVAGTPTNFTQAGMLTIGVPSAVVPPVAPSNSGGANAPSISGTPHVNSTLAASVGTWSGDAPITYADQWQSAPDSSGAPGTPADIAGATSSTYAIDSSADPGRWLRVKVTATNAGGSATAFSDWVHVPAKPSLAPGGTPQITPGAPYSTNEVVHCDGGSWLPTGADAPTLTYQWFRGISPETGETLPDHTLLVSEEGANVFCRVTATNGGGTTTSDSNTIVPDVTAAPSDDSFLLYYSGGTGNTSASASTGGDRGGTVPIDSAGKLNNLVGPITAALRRSGGVIHRGVFMRYVHPTTSVPSLSLYVLTQFAADSGLHVRAGVPPEGINTPIQVLADETQAPTGVVWTDASDVASGEDYGGLGPNDFRGIWLEFTIAPNAAPSADDDFDVVVEGNV
jgi:hypothetical protein